MHSELQDMEKALYLNILKNSTYYKELFDFERCKEYLTKTSIIKISKTLINFIQSTKYDKVSRILPIITSPNIDKLEIFDTIKAKIPEARLIYVPSPPDFVGIFYHVYNCVIEELGVKYLEEVSKSIQAQNVKRTRCVNGLINYFHHKQKAKDNILDIENEVRAAENSLELIQLITKFSNEVIVLYFDDLELPYERFGGNTENKLLESIKRLHRDAQQLVIILVCSKNSWAKILNLASESFSSILGPEIEFYDTSQLRIFVKKAMEEYWIKNNISSPKNPYFPFNEGLIDIFFEKTKGNLRSFLKICIEIIRKIILGEIIE